MKNGTITTNSGLPVKSVYRPCDSRIRYEEDLGDPGRFPFTRGIHPQMHRQRLWTMRQYTGFGSPHETNLRFKFLIRQGQTGLSVAFDLPTQLGMDSDDPRAEGEVGRVGVPVCSVEDIADLFSGIDLSKISTSMTINATASIILAMYVTVAESRDAAPGMLRGTTQNDILKEFIARNTFIFPPRPSLKIAVDIIEYCAKRMRHWYPISISGYHIREAGATAIQELAYTFADGKEYVKECLERRLKVDQFAPRLSFFFACQNEFLEEVAKFRAARRIWARIMKEEFHARNPESMMLRFHTQTSGETLTAQQPQNNVVRVAIQALAAALGGTQSLHTNSLDEALSLPTEESVKIALRTQQIVAHESGVTKTADALGGSYYVEALTDKIEEHALDELRRIDRMGGAMKAIEKGYIQSQIRESAFRQQQDIETGRKIVVGVNKYKAAELTRIRIHTIDPKIARMQVTRIRALRRRRNSAALEKRLRILRLAAVEHENLMPAIHGAVHAKATTGEISGILREVYGEFRPKTFF